MSKEAMKLALEALEHCKDVIVERGLNGNPEFAKKWGLTLPLERSESAITALREALAEQPAQQEPVATITITQRGPIRIIDNNFDDCVRGWPDGEYKLYTSPPAQQEPVAYAVYHRKGGGKSLHWPEQHSPDGDANEYQLVPLYTSPQPAQRTWVGLTDEEIDVAWNNCEAPYGFAEDIEAKLKEKNT